MFFSQCNHVINTKQIFFFLEIERQRNFPPLFLLHKLHNPTLPPCPRAHSARELKPYTPPLPSQFLPTIRTLFLSKSLSYLFPTLPFPPPRPPRPSLTLGTGGLLRVGFNIIFSLFLIILAAMQPYSYQGTLSLTGNTCVSQLHFRARMC